MNFKKMTFLCMQKLTNFPYIEADFDAITNYELLCKVVEYLNKVIANENAQNEALNELATAFNNLKSYVDNYFDNLDVQEEINNKLDEMAESGQLTDIIAQYLGLAGMIAFDTVADMKEAENLVNGSKCRTLGFRSVNDGGGAYYKIRTVTNDDVIDEKTIIEVYDNTLVAELIINDYVTPEMLGAYGDGTHDDTLSIQTAINKFNNIKFGHNKTYKITRKGFLNHLAFNEEMYYSLLISKSNIKIDGNNSTLLNNDENETSFFINNVSSLKNIEIKNLNIIMDNESYVYIPVSGTTKIKGISLSYCDNINISNINFKTIKGDCIEILDADNVNVNNINVDDVVGHGLSLGKPSHGITRLTVENCYIKNQHIYDQIISTNPMIIGAENGYINNVYMKSCEWGFKIEPPSKNVKVINCTFDTGSDISDNTGFKTQGDALNLVEDIIFDNCKVLNNLSNGHAFYDIYSKNVIIKNCDVIKSKGVRLQGQNVLIKDCYFYDSKQPIYIRNESNIVNVKDLLIEIDSSDYFDTAFINNQATTNKVIVSGITIKSTVSDLSRYLTLNNCDCDNIYIYAPDIIGSGKIGGVGANTKINNCNFNASLGKVFKLDCSSGTSTRFTSAAFPFGTGICASFSYIPFNCTVSAVNQLNNNIDFTHTEDANAYILIYLLDYYKAV